MTENILILYEDESLLAINKPAGLVVHCDGHTEELAVTDWVSKVYPEMSEVGESFVLKNGETIILGGLIKETRTTVETKVPFIGDLPLLGALFRKDTDSVVRKNLLIFVTASILGQKGERLK